MSENEKLTSFDGTVLRSTSERAKYKDSISIEEVGLVPENRVIRILQKSIGGGEKNLEPVEAQEISGLVVPAVGKERTEVIFRHPGDTSRLIGVVLDDVKDGERGEVDGVWVAEEGGGLGTDQ